MSIIGYILGMKYFKDAKIWREILKSKGIEVKKKFF